MEINSGSNPSNEVYSDLNSFAEAKNSIKDLINYRRSLLDVEDNNIDRIAEFKQKALKALDDLFDEYSVPSRKK